MRLLYLKFTTRNYKKYFQQLDMDLMLWGNAYEEKYEPNLIQKIISDIKGVPNNRRRIHPSKVKIISEK